MKRRSFLRHMTHGVAVPGMMGAMGFKMPGSQSFESLLKMANDQDKVLVLIFLEGGNDGLNTVIPLDQLSNLNQVRPHVILPENDLIPLRQSEVALHPALSDMSSLYDEGRFQIIQNVGYPEQNFSHFRSTDIWMSASESNEVVNSGWTGRYLQDRYPGYPETYPSEAMTDPLAVEIGYGGSLLFQGPQAAMSMVISDPNFFYQLVNNEEAEAPNTPAGDKLRYIRLIERQSQQYGEVVRAAGEKGVNAASYQQNFIGEQLKIVSRLISGGLKTPVYMVRLGGFDTHDAQVESSDHTIGEHATLLKDLNDAIISFVRDLDSQGLSDRVLGMTFSEFGRRIVSNASLGTDHGSAAPMFFFGNNLVGGVTGNNPDIPRNAVYDDNLPWEYDFREIYTSVLDQWFGVDENAISSSMLGSFDTTPIIGNTRLLSLEKNTPDRGINLYPNPVVGEVSIDCFFAGEQVVLHVFDYSGRLVAKPFSGPHRGTIKWNAADLPRGRYLMVAASGKEQKSFPFVKH